MTSSAQPVWLNSGTFLVRDNLTDFHMFAMRRFDAGYEYQRN